MALPDAVRWPPVSLDHAAHLENWMTVTSVGAIRTLLKSGAIEGGTKLLDVGGGDGNN